MVSEKYDVIVVGAGPGGSVAAKKCAERGFRTLLLEKRRLPREKVCTGMVMGPWAHGIIQDEFGDIPREILVSPYHLRGHMIHVPGADRQRIEWRTPLAWRKDLDFWMNQIAKERGVVIWDGARVIRVGQGDGKCTVALEKEGAFHEISAGFVIGADGATSSVRKSLFPGLKVRYSAPVRQCFRGALSIEREYIHWFFPRNRHRPRFDLIHKGDVFLIEGSGIRALRQEIETVLSPYGYTPGTRPLWQDGCLMPLLHSELFSGAFTPARENILLIGDAAGLFFPVTYEGIGAALKSGILAADSVAATSLPGEGASLIYLHAMKSFLQQLEKLYFLQESLAGASDLSTALKTAYEETLRVV
jgi:flavin-dependent dehydrogenase